MPFTEWSSFKRGFNQYIRRTTGLFTLIDPSNLVYFDLDMFLARICERAGELSHTQVEMLMALSTYIDIKEAEAMFPFNIIPTRVILHLKNLIERDYIQIHPFSVIKKCCLAYLGAKKAGYASASASSAPAA
jgi:hypothetical protein